MKNNFNFRYLNKDIPSGLVVFLVALPLCLGIASASGAPFFSGIISGIVGGIVIAFFSNSALSVSGPAAGLASLVLGAILAIGNFPLFLCAVLIAGVIQILLGVLRLGGIANYIPSSVIKGMLTSIGILIIAKQIPKAFGYDRDEQGNLTELFPFGNENLTELLQPLNHIELGTILLCIISIVIMLLWERPFIKQRVPAFIPGALVAVIVSLIINEIFIALGSPLSVLGDHLVKLPKASNVSEFLGFFTLPDFNGFLNSTVIMYGVFIAIIASLETLLSIEAIDNLDPERRVTNTNRELVAQGIGNSVSALIGGLPITSVIVRSSANVNAGAKTKMSSIIHGLFLLICVVFIPALLNKIPLSSLAAILILTGWKLAKPKVFMQMFQHGKYQFIPFIVTVVVIILIDLFGLPPVLKGKGLIIGVIAGIIAAIGAVLHGNLKNSHYYHADATDDALHINMHLAQEVSFLNKADIRAKLDEIPANAIVKIDASETEYIDFDVLELIKEFRDIKAPLKNINCQLIGFSEEYRMHTKAAVAHSH